jgi:hypothetical protein
MLARSIFTAFGALVVVSGCAHYQTTGRPPTVEEVEAINRSAGDGPGAMTLRYVDAGNPCSGGACSVDGSRAISDSPPFGIERIAQVDAQRMTVVAETGAAWQLDLSKVAGVSTRRPATLTGGLVGAGVGLGMAGALLLIMHLFAPSSDAVTSASARLPSTTAQIDLTIVFASLGAFVGAMAGHQGRTSEYFDFGGGHLFPSPSFSR